MASGCCVNGVHMKAACGVLSSPITDTHIYTHTHRDGYGVRSPSAYWAWQISPQVLERRERETDFAWHPRQFLRGWSSHHNPLHHPSFSSATSHRQPPLSLNQPPCINRHSHLPPLILLHLNVTDFSMVPPQSDLMWKAGKLVRCIYKSDSWHTHRSYHKWCDWELRSFWELWQRFP